MRPIVCGCARTSNFPLLRAPFDPSPACTWVTRRHTSSCGTLPAQARIPCTSPARRGGITPMHHVADRGRREVSAVYPFLVASMVLGHAPGAKASKVYVFNAAPHTTFQVRKNGLSAQTVTSSGAGSFHFEITTTVGRSLGLFPRFHRASGPAGRRDDASAIARTGTELPESLHPSTKIPFVLEQSGRVVVRVFDVAGSHVATVFDGQLAEGRQSVDWDGRDVRGQSVASGVYLSTPSRPARGRCRRRWCW